MSKIVEVANAIISNPRYISDVIPAEGELFFLYKGKYRWSIKMLEDSFYLYFYPGNPSMEKITTLGRQGNWDALNMIVYSSGELGTVEAYQTFAELYNLIKEKAFGIDEAFEDILSDMDLV